MAKVKVKKNRFDVALNVFAWLSFFLAVILSLAVLFSTFSGSENGKSIFGYKMLIVQSDSMTKSEISKNEKIFFATGDLIFIKEVSDMSTISVGDVITFVSYNSDSRGKTLSHKVRSILTDGDGNILGFETYGIKTGASDQTIVDPSTVMGKYVGKSPALGRLFTFFKTPAGYFTSILIPCVLLIIFFSIKVGKMIAKKEMLDKYDGEFESLRKRIFDLENNKNGELVEMNLQEKVDCVGNADQLVQQGIEQDKADNQQVGSFVQQTVSNGQPIVQIPSYNDKALELTAKALTNTIETLTRTIETLAMAVGKPVETLARSVETLASATTKPTVVEKVVEKPVVQTIIKEVPVQPLKEEIEEATITVAPEEKIEVPKEQAELVTEDKIDFGTESMFDSFKQHEKVPFNKKLTSLASEIKEYFAEVHNELVSYKKVSYRISFKGISYRVGRKTIAKMVVRGKTLKLHLALGLEDFSKTVFFQEDSGNIKAYEDVPFTVKIKSARGRNNAIKLINSLAENNSLIKGEQAKKENILKELQQYK